jgi:hypothetical protein
MIRFLFRFLGLWLLAGAFVALVIDGTRSVSASQFVAYPVRDVWALLDPMGLAGLQKQFAGGTLERVFELLLATPFFAFLGVLGLLFVLIGRKKRIRTIGYSSRD